MIIRLTIKIGHISIQTSILAKCPRGSAMILAMLSVFANKGMAMYRQIKEVE